MKSSEQQLARGLGWFSTGLGVALLVSPRRIARLVGLRDTPGTRRLLRGVGVQELSAAGGIFSMGKPAPWTWARVAGDVSHLSLLGRALVDPRNRRGRTVAATAAVAGVTALDALAARRLSGSHGGALEATATVTVNRPHDEAYAAWRDLERLPTFLWHLESVTVDAGGRSHWKAKAPAGRSVEWDAEIVDDIAGERISWRSLPGATVPNRGTVRFRPAPGDQGTEVTVELVHEPPGGAAGVQIAQLFGESPTQQLHDDLRRFKQVLETGEVVRSDGSPDGTRVQRQWHQEDGQPKQVVA